MERDVSDGRPLRDRRPVDAGAVLEAPRRHLREGRLQFAVALKYGYDVWIKTLDGNFGNTHGVREADYNRMVADFLTDDQLELIWLDNPRVRFGNMPNGYVIEPMEDGK